MSQPHPYEPFLRNVYPKGSLGDGMCWEDCCKVIYAGVVHTLLQEKERTGRLATFFTSEEYRLAYERSPFYSNITPLLLPHVRRHLGEALKGYVKEVLPDVWCLTDGEET